MWSLVWSVGGNVDGVEGKEKFSDFIRETFPMVRFPNSGTVYDYVLDSHGKEWQPWEEVTKPFVYNPDVTFSDILVPTKDTCRYSYLLGTCIEGREREKGEEVGKESQRSKLVSRKKAMARFAMTIPRCALGLLQDKYLLHKRFQTLVNVCKHLRLGR